MLQYIRKQCIVAWVVSKQGGKMKQQIHNTALYCRLSRDDEQHGESSSISTQRQMLRLYATERGWNITDEYIDDGWSGTNFDRPGFERMIEDIEDGKVNCVVTKDLSRLGRNYILTGQYTELYFPSKGVRYIAINDGVDSINGENEIAPFKNILNEMVARDTSRKVKSALKTKFQNGDFVSPMIPLGYKKNPDIKGKLIPDEETKWIVEKIFDLAAHGMGAATIQRQLRAEKIPTPTWWRYNRDGSWASRYENQPESRRYLWSIKTVSTILESEVYLGHSVHYKQGTVSFKNKKLIHRPKDEWLKVENTHEPIISQEQWDLVHSHIKSRRRPRKNDNSDIQIFSGLLKCGHCGWNLSMSKNNHGHSYYRCAQYTQQGKEICTSHHIPFNLVYSIVLGRLQYWLQELQNSEVKLLDRLLKSGDKHRESELKHSTKELQKAEKRQKELDNVFAKMYEDRASGSLDERNYAMLSGKYQTEQRQIAEQIETFAEKLYKSEHTKSGAQRWIELILKHSEMAELTAPMLNELIDKIVVHQSYKDENGNKVWDIDIYYRFVGKIE